MSTKTITRDVDVDLSEWETDELIDEILNRDSDIKIVDISDGLEEWEQMAFTALQKGNKDEAIEILRSHLCDASGRVLP